jgi:hypothetical protein
MGVNAPEIGLHQVVDDDGRLIGRYARLAKNRVAEFLEALLGDEL